MSNREEKTFDQSPNGTDDEDAHIQPSESQDIHNRNGITPESTASSSQSQDENPTYELEEDLNNGLATLKIDDVKKLAEEIQQTKERIKYYREDGKKEEAEKEIPILMRLENLTLLNGTITKLKSTPSVEGSSSVMELYRLEQELINRMEKLKIDDKNKLPEKIEQTKERIENYRKDDKEEETEKEMQILMPLKHLKLLDVTITELKSTRWVEESNSVIELSWLEQVLINGLEKLKVDDVNKLSKEIQQNEKRIKYYREVGKEEETKKEEQISTQLKHLTLVNGTITKLKSIRLAESSSSVMEPRPLEQELVSCPGDGLRLSYTAHIRPYAV
jgi:transcriptional regulator of met regulon